MLELYKKNDNRLQNIENIQFEFSQQATYFAPELISKESIDEMIQIVQDNPDDIIWIYTLVTKQEVQNIDFKKDSAKKTLLIVYLKLVDNASDQDF